LRTALKVLKPIYSFRANNEQALYKGISGVNWSKLLNANQTFVIDATVHSTYFNHSEFVSQKCKDAIVDQFRERTGQRPSIDKAFPDLRINVHIDKDQVRLLWILPAIHCTNAVIERLRILHQSTKFWRQEFYCYQVGKVKVTF
jgi:23S rRNA G2445 N2-methylase RlmL